VLEQLDGYELAAGAWERHILPLRVQGYTAASLDQLCFAGEVAWGRLSLPSVAGRPDQTSARPIRSSPISMFLRRNADAWLTLARTADASSSSLPTTGEEASCILDRLRARGASFVSELAGSLGMTDDEIRRGLSELVAAGLVTSDGFAGLRAMLARRHDGVVRAGSFRSRVTFPSAASAGGRWSLLRADDQPDLPHEAAVERLARALLTRYGIVCRRLLARESQAAPWREQVSVFRRLEARGEIRGGRFVTGMSGEQFALPEAVERMREVRRTPASGALIVISGADPLNLVGIVSGDERVPALSGTRLAFRDGVALAVMEGDYVRQLHEYEPEAASAVSSALAGRHVRTPVSNGFVGRVEALR
jgi:ATP-dependent Lhr-like helicase